MSRQAYLTIAVLLSSVFTTTLAIANESPVQTTTLDKVQDAQGNTTAQIEVNQDITTLISPRTGIRYSLGKVGKRTVILETPAVIAANVNTVQRIVASNPALSAASQDKAKQSLLSDNFDPNR